MKSALYSEMIRKKVDTPAKKGKSKVVEILAMEGDGYWTAGEVMIESGLVNMKGRFIPVSELKYLSDEGRFKSSISLKKGNKKPMDDHELHLSHIDGKKVLSHKDEEIGRVYDFEIYVDFTPWKVWKILVDPSGLSPLKRRIKIPTKGVQEVKDDNSIVLKKGVEK